MPSLPESLSVLADPHVVDGVAPATYVAHRRDGAWVFGAPGFLDRAADRFLRVPVARLLAIDPALAEICDLPVGWHAFRDSARDPWWSAEMPTGQTFLLTYEVRPTEAVADRDGIGGAFVHAWIVSGALAEARDRARAHLEETGWAVVRDLGEQAVDAGAATGDAEAYYRQAQVDGEVFVIHAFPPDEPDA
jgi:hypothetical protein